MGAWVTTLATPPPVGKTIMVRFGASIFFAAFSNLFGWQMLAPEGRTENIEDPTLWWCPEAESKDDQSVPEPQKSASTFRRSKAPKQLALALDDSKSQSK